MSNLFDAEFFTPDVDLSPLSKSEEREPYTEPSREWLPALRRVAAGLVAASVFVVGTPASATEPLILRRAVVAPGPASRSDAPEPDRIYSAQVGTVGLARLLLKTPGSARATSRTQTLVLPRVGATLQGRPRRATGNDLLQRISSRERRSSRALDIRINWQGS